MVRCDHRLTGRRLRTAQKVVRRFRRDPGPPGSAPPDSAPPDSALPILPRRILRCGVDPAGSGPPSSGSGRVPAKPETTDQRAQGYWPADRPVRHAGRAPAAAGHMSAPVARPPTGPAVGATPAQAPAGRAPATTASQWCWRAWSKHRRPKPTSPTGRPGLSRQPPPRLRIRRRGAGTTAVGQPEAREPVAAGCIAEAAGCSTCPRAAARTASRHRADRRGLAQTRLPAVGVAQPLSGLPPWGRSGASDQSCEGCSSLLPIDHLDSCDPMDIAMTPLRRLCRVVGYPNFRSPQLVGRGLLTR